jgi:CDP-diacylglycerol--glycerol-3-phosphate 3-phosphatidyltransferase
LFDGRWLPSVDRLRDPLAPAIRRAGVNADHLTALGMAAALGTALAVATGRLGLGLVLLAVTALADLLDGPVAKASGRAGPRGAFFDSVADRVTDSLVLGGVAWYLATREGAHAAVLPLAVLATSNLISYERAKAESLGYTAKGGLMERAERIIMLSVGLAFSAILVPLLWVMLALTLVTAVHRFVSVWRQAGAGRTERRAQAGMEGRWRAWRERTWSEGAHGGSRRVAWRQAGRAGRPERSWRRARTRP